MQLSELSSFLLDLYQPQNFLHLDDSQNGLQIEPAQKEINTIAFAVDASQATFRQAAAQKADLLIVHHGLFWGNKPSLLTGLMYSRVKTLLDAGIGLFAMHLPMDAHPTLGHNALLADKIALTNRQPFADVGWVGELPVPLSLEEVIKKLGLPAHQYELVKNNDRPIKKVGLVSGGGGGTIYSIMAINAGCDLYFTGELSHSSVIFAKEAGINMIAAGHYWTETFGLVALQSLLEDKFGVNTVWLDEPTGW